jgi:chromosome segregation ATPase
MSQTETQLRRIQDKLQQLVKQHALVRKENQQLKEQLTAASQQSQQLSRNMDELRQQVNVLKLNAGEMNESDKKEMEKKINGYIKEIDRCIALLSE